MTVFEASGSSDPLGLWATVSPAVSFGFPDESAADPAMPVYRVRLPESEGASIRTLAENLANFQRLDAALDRIPARLDGLVLQARAQPGISFSAPAAAPGTELESELFSLLADASARSAAGPAGVSFGFGTAAGQAFAQAKEKLETLLEQVNHEVLHFAWVETEIAGQIIARSEVGWSGDSATFWNPATPAEQLSLHQRTLEIVSQTRHLKLRLLLTAVSGAVKMAGLMAAPGGAVLALPAVYQYVLKILQQVKEIQSIEPG
jgi:hypothetical protein